MKPLNQNRMVIVKIITGIALMSLGVIFLYFVGKITKKLFWPEAVNDKDFVVVALYGVLSISIICFIIFMFIIAYLLGNSINEVIEMNI